MQPAPCEVYAIRLGRVMRQAGDNFLMSKRREGEMQLDFDMWIIVREGLVVVVDTGMSSYSEKRRGRKMDLTPARAIRFLGIDPGSVPHVVLSHLHYDHAGRTDEFPDATIWLQKRETDYALGASMGHEALSHFFEVEDLKMMLDRIFASTVRVVDGTHEIAPGIELHLIGGHTRGLQVVRVFTERGWVVLASDALHYYENMELRDPFPSIVDVCEMLDGYDRLAELADSAEHIIPGHDPQVMERYARDASGLPDGVVALHRPPRDGATTHKRTAAARTD